LHGLLGNALNFSRVMHDPSLTAAYDVCALDLVNHGASPRLAEAADVSLPALAADVVHTVASLLGTGAPSGGCTFVGHSLGGKVVAQVALAHPSLVAHAVVVDIVPLPYAPSAPPLAAIEAACVAVDAVAVGTCPSRADVEARLMPVVPDTAVRRFLMQNLVALAGGGYAWRVRGAAMRAMFAAAMGPLYPATAGSNRVPAADASVSFVRGGSSDFVRDAQWPAVLSLFPRAQLHTVADAGHFVHADQPAEFVALLHRLLLE
jgi:pimeloyl-ACP methyl ester carboxylesterase